MPPNHFESEVESFLEGSHGDRTHIKRADHHTVTPLCGTLLRSRVGRETGVAFAGVYGPVLGGWSRALVLWVSNVSVGRRALVLWVSCRPV